jgi:hypothetical protein
VYVGGEDADGGGGAMAEAVLAAADGGESTVEARGSCGAEPVAEQLALGWSNAVDGDATDGGAASAGIKLGNRELPCIGAEIAVHWAEER